MCLKIWGQMDKNNGIWHDRVRRLATDPVVMRSSPATDIYDVYCWLSSPNKVNLLSWLLVYLYNK